MRNRTRKTRLPTLYTTTEWKQKQAQCWNGTACSKMSVATESKAKERERNKCVSHASNRTCLICLGALQVEMLIFFLCSKEDCNFTLFTKLNSMIDLPRIATLGSLILNAMHSPSLSFTSPKSTAERDWVHSKFGPCVDVRDFETFRFICANIHRGVKNLRVSALAETTIAIKSQNHTLFMQQNNKKNYMRDFSCQVISRKQYMWTKQQSRWYETFSWFSRIYGDGDGTGVRGCFASSRVFVTCPTAVGYIKCLRLLWLRMYDDQSHGCCCCCARICLFRAYVTSV